MPYKKRYRKNQNKGKMPLSSRQVKAVQKIATKSTLKVAETKMLPKEQADQLIGPDDACAVFTDITQLATQGTDNEQRIGDHVISRGLQVQYSIENTSANPFGYLVRVIACKAEAGELVNTTDTILTSTSNDPLAPVANTTQDILRSLNRKQMRVLYDRTHKVQSFTTTSTANLVMVKKFIKLNDKRTFLLDTAGDSRGLSNVRFYVIVRDCGGATVSAGNDINFNLYTRYYYKDV